MSRNTASARVDVRAIAPRERHPLIFSTFAQLGEGEVMELVNDHDPRPLHYQFQAELPGAFSWDYLEQGPEVWRVAITRLAGARGSAGKECCGHCA